VEERRFSAALSIRLVQIREVTLEVREDQELERKNGVESQRLLAAACRA